MNAFNTPNNVEAYWHWRKDLLGADCDKKSVGNTGSYRLEKVAEDLMHLVDVTCQKVVLVLRGEAPSLDEAKQTALASAMEEALVQERANRLPVY